MHMTFRYQMSAIIFASFFRVERILEFFRKPWHRREAAKAEQPEPSHAPGMAAGHASQFTIVGAPSPPEPHATLYYDGECGLCDQFVQFVLRHDHRGYFQFATLQSAAGR